MSYETNSLVALTSRNCTATPVHVDAQGYDANGRYWGASAETLYLLEAKDAAKFEFAARFGRRRADHVFVRGANAADARKRAMSSANGWLIVAIGG